jgi:mRNA interferase ChpB
VLDFGREPFNQGIQLAMVYPVSGLTAAEARDTGFLISLMRLRLKTDGCVHVHQLKTLDWTSRKAKRIEKVPEAIVQPILSCLISVFEANLAK